MGTGRRYKKWRRELERDEERTRKCEENKESCAGGVIEVVSNVFVEVAGVYLEREMHSGMKSCSSLLLSLLDIIHCLLKNLSSVVRLALRRSDSNENTEAAEELLLINKPLTDLNNLLIQLMAERPETSFPPTHSTQLCNPQTYIQLVYVCLSGKLYPHDPQSRIQAAHCARKN
ncbi:unnamed protein product [Leuciscus chuanchicus]